MPTNQSIDLKEIKKFEDMASEWWDPQGKFKPLHHMNPCRLDYIISQIEIEFNRSTKDKNAFNGIDILDIGCGGGLLSEPMARLGANVTGVDAAEKNIPIAQIHAKQSGLNIDYKTLVGIFSLSCNRHERKFRRGDGGYVSPLFFDRRDVTLHYLRF